MSIVSPYPKLSQELSQIGKPSGRFGYPKSFIPSYPKKSQIVEPGFDKTAPRSLHHRLISVDLWPILVALWAGRGNGLDAGDAVEVELGPEGPQFADLAPDIAAALDVSPPARAFFEGLATFYRTGYLRWIDGARQPETRASRIREMVGLLEAGKRQR